MSLPLIDWLIIGGTLLAIVALGLAFSRRAGQNLQAFFLSGRQLPWYVAGLSMVATTFGADTPLAVTELVRERGIAGNWLWWNFLLGGMLTTFFFAELWRRAGIITEVELVRIRYSGIGARILRYFKAIYLGVGINALIIGWVNLALITLLQVFFDCSFQEALWYTALAMALVALYSALAGLWGVVVTDFIQFTLAMGGCIALAWLVLDTEAVGGMAGLRDQLPPGTLRFFPVTGEANAAADTLTTLSIGFGAFFAYMGMQWWTSWYPGAEPGGGGYIAQRMMSSKDEKQALYATLFFQFLHYCLRPWPWIIVALCTIVLYPHLDAENHRLGFVLAIRDHLPSGWQGILLAGMLGAYMSTISTQLNWGASYVVNDFFKPMHRKTLSDRKLVWAARLTTVLLMLLALAVTSQIRSIKGVWEFIIECGAGLGPVLMLRWYWWRINAWSELTATLTPFAGYAIARFVLGLAFPDSFFFTIALTTACWLAVTYLTTPTTASTLQAFYRQVRPGGAWRPVRETLNASTNIPQGASAGRLAVCWVSAVVAGYGLLLGTGKLLFMEWMAGLGYAVACLVGVGVLVWGMRGK